MSAVPSFLMSRNGIWYLNYRIPTLIKKRYSINKQFIRKSLRTTDVYEAVKLSRKYTALLMSRKKKGSGLMKISAQTECADQQRALMLFGGDQDILNFALQIGRRVADEYGDREINGTYAEHTEFWMRREDQSFFFLSGRVADTRTPFWSVRFSMVIVPW